MQTGKYRLAEYHFRKAVDINPTNATLVCCVGSVRRFGRRYLVVGVSLTLSVSLSLFRSSRSLVDDETPLSFTSVPACWRRRVPRSGSSVSGF